MSDPLPTSELPSACRGANLLQRMVREILPVKPGERADRGTCPESVESGISKPWPLPVGVTTARDYFPNAASEPHRHD
jgi:hypothetical protein